MRDLRLVGCEDGTIVFESLEGEKYRVLADDALRHALRQASQSRPAELSITPREIQDRVRSGETVEQLAASTGADADFIEKFAQPVLDELKHIVQSALAIRITIAGDRFNDDVQEEFGTLISSRLAANGALDLAWSSKRAEGGVWLLSASYNLNGHPGLALWAFEPRKFHLTPENESAISLSNHSSAMDSPLAKLRPVSNTSTPNVSSPSAPAETPTSLPVSDSAPLSTDAPAAFRKQEVPSAPVTQPETESSASDLLDELRKRRETPLADSVEEETPDESSDFDEQYEPSSESDMTGPLQVVPDFEVSDLANDVDSQEIPAADFEEVEETVVESQTVESPTQPKKGRATMPSWDQIVFGTKTDDEI